MRETLTGISTTIAAGPLPKVAWGKGGHVTDSTGKTYVDGSGGPAVYSPGYGNDEVTDAIKTQLDRIMHGYRCTFTSDPLEELTEYILAGCGPEFGAVVLVSGGSEAMKSCLKIKALTGIDVVGDLRGRGYFIGIELVTDPVTKTPFPRDQQLFLRVRECAFADGLICYPSGGNVDGVLGDTIILAPRYNTPDAELADIAGKLGVSVRQAAAGAAVLHVHVRDPSDGSPSADPALFADVVARLRAGTDAILSLTTGGSARMTLEERLAGPMRSAPELCSLNLGTMNFAMLPMAARARNWRFVWEKPFLERTRDGVFRNTFADMETIIRTLGDRFGTRFEFEAYDVGHLYSLAHLRDRGLAQPRPFVQFVLGILGGIGADGEALDMMQTTARRLFGADIEWSVVAGGRAQMALCEAAIMAGGHVRVGLEDNLWLGPGRLATSNAECVAAAVTLVERHQRRPATPAEARVRLGLAA